MITSGETKEIKLILYEILPEATRYKEGYRLAYKLSDAEGVEPWGSMVKSKQELCNHLESIICNKKFKLAKWMDQIFET